MFDILVYGLSVAFVGMATVFLGLIILIGMVKGLEFDCVLIADAEDATYPDERFYAKLFYVLCTRPLHRLAFVYHGACTRHLPTCQNPQAAV